MKDVPIPMLRLPISGAGTKGPTPVRCPWKLVYGSETLGMEDRNQVVL